MSPAETSQRPEAARAALLLVLLAAAPEVLADEMRGPWEARPPASAAPETRPEVLAARGALRAFQRFVSPVDGPRCNLYPTCSEFARQAVRRYGLLAGIVLTAGRLMRDNASAHLYYRRALVGGQIVLYDPPEDHWPPGGGGAGR
jgi:uncharacterized protein